MPTVENDYPLARSSWLARHSPLVLIVILAVVAGTLAFAFHEQQREQYRQAAKAAGLTAEQCQFLLRMGPSAVVLAQGISPNPKVKALSVDDGFRMLTRVCSTLN